MKLHKSTLLLMVLFGPNSGLGAEDVLAPGERLRITAPLHPRHQFVGTLIAEDADSLRLEVGKEVITLPRQSVTKLEISRARSRKTRGAHIGLLAGAVSGAALGYAIGEDSSQSVPFCTFGGCATLGPFWPNRPTSAIIVGIFFGAVGAGVGALVSPREKWESVPSRRVRLRLAPTPGRGVAAQVTIGFGGRTR